MSLPDDDVEHERATAYENAWEEWAASDDAELWSQSSEAAGDHLDALVDSGEVRPPTNTGRRHRPGPRIEAKGSVSDLVGEQRR